MIPAGGENPPRQEFGVVKQPGAGEKWEMGLKGDDGKRFNWHDATSASRLAFGVEHFGVTGRVTALDGNQTFWRTTIDGGVFPSQ